MPPPEIGLLFARFVKMPIDGTGKTDYDENKENWSYRQRNGIISDKSISKITYISRFFTYVTVVFRSFRRPGILDQGLYINA